MAPTRLTLNGMLNWAVRLHTRASGAATTSQTSFVDQPHGGFSVVQMSSSMVSTPSSPRLHRGRHSVSSPLNHDMQYLAGKSSRREEMHRSRLQGVLWNRVTQQCGMKAGSEKGGKDARRVAGCRGGRLPVRHVEQADRYRRGRGPAHVSVKGSHAVPWRVPLNAHVQTTHKVGPQMQRMVTPLHSWSALVL